MRSKYIKYYFFLSFMLSLLAASAFGQHMNNPISLYPISGPVAFPVARFQKIKVADFRKLIISSFEESDFEFASIKKTSSGQAWYKFNYLFPSNFGENRLVLSVLVDDEVGERSVCENCFLRRPAVAEDYLNKNIPWITQYDVSREMFLNVDKAYARISEKGKPYIDKSIGFDYRKIWNEERSLGQNSFTNVGLMELKSTITDAFVKAGFVSVGDSNAAQTSRYSELSFYYPINPENKAGIVYKFWIFAQFSETGSCFSCEVSESFDVYQPLPASGLTGVLSRLSLDSRFTAARTRAFADFKNSTERHLRPGTTFKVPPKEGTLGRTRPQFIPIVT
jgi:hypothetical protein